MMMDLKGCALMALGIIVIGGILFAAGSQVWEWLS